MTEQIFVPSKDKKNPEAGLTSVLDQKKNGELQITPQREATSETPANGGNESADVFQNNINKTN